MHNIKKLLSSSLKNNDDFVLMIIQRDSSNSSNNNLSWMHLNYYFSRRKNVSNFWLCSWVYIKTCTDILNPPICLTSLICFNLSNHANHEKKGNIVIRALP